MKTVIICLLGLGLIYSVTYNFNFRLPDFIESFLNVERCNSYWITHDIEGLMSDVKNKVFGQPFIQKSLIPLLKEHFKDKNPSKPLVISLHGSQGTGKTYVSQIIADYTFRKGRDSKFYKFFSVADIQPLTQKEFINEIINHASGCPNTFFVFEEIEKTPNGTFDVIKSFLDYHHKVGDVDFRKTVFIFISNIGMGRTNDLTKKLWENGQSREDFKLSSFQNELQKIVEKADGGLKGTGVVKSYLMDLYLPFLPLEKQHVEQCIRFLDSEITQENIKIIMDELVFVPPSAPIYSLSGCKVIRSALRRLKARHDEL